MKDMALRWAGKPYGRAVARMQSGDWRGLRVPDTSGLSCFHATTVARTQSGMAEGADVKRNAKLPTHADRQIPTPMGQASISRARTRPALSPKVSPQGRRSSGCCQDHRPALVAAADELEEQVGAEVERDGQMASADAGRSQVVLI